MPKLKSKSAMRPSTKRLSKKEKEYKMVVPVQTQNLWLTKWRAGDNGKISLATGLSLSTIVDAIKNGRATQKTVELIRGYYE